MRIPTRIAATVIALATWLGSGPASPGVVEAGEPGLTLYMASTAEPDGDGTQAKPFASLEDARDAIRARRRQGTLPGGEVTVVILPGCHVMNAPLALSAEDGGSDSSPIVYRAAVRGMAVLSGAVQLLDWQPATDDDVGQHLLPAARGHVVWAELPPAVPESVPGFTNGGSGFRGRPEYPVALFQNGRRLPIARWPNEGFAKMGVCLGHSEKRGHVGTTYTDGVFQFESDRLARWANEPDGWLDGLWFHHWADQKMRLKQVDPAAQTIALKDPKSHAYGFKAGQQFYAFNMVSEIDRPGEWAVDRASRRLYLWPAGDVKEDPVSVAACDQLLVLDGVANVRFEGLTIEGSRETAVTAKNCSNVTFSGCTFRHLGSWAVDINGGKGCTVYGCDLYDLGEGGIRASGGVRDSLEPGNHLIENNHIHHFGRIVGTYRPGAAVYGVSNRIRHNLIYQAQHQAIYFRGNDHLIEYNIVHDVCLHSSDAGALYACTRDWSQRGTVIRHNMLHALGKGLDGTGCRAIYLDDMTSGTTVQSNIVTMGDHGLNFGGGQDNLITDNIAINCQRALNLASRGVDSFARVNAEKGRDSVQYKLLLRDEALFRGPLWQSRYPRLLTPLEMDPVDAQNAHFNVIRRNVNVGGGPLAIGNAKKVMRTCIVEDNLDLHEDPGFVNLAALDLRLRDDAPLRSKLPDYQAPDFAKMGLYDDPRRASPAVKFGPHVTPLSPIMTPEARAEAERPLLVSVPGCSGPIRLDGRLDDSEWAGEETGVLRDLEDGAASVLSSRVWLRVDQENLYVALDNTIASEKPTRGSEWGADDGFEIVLAPAYDGRLPNRLEGLVVRGYAGGAITITRAGQNQPVGSVLAEASQRGRWTAELAIPLQAIGVNPSETNLPIFCHVTVRSAAEDQWRTWRKRWSLDPSDATCACVLWPKPFGSLPFVPGYPASAIRIDVQGDRNAGRTSMTPGEDAEAPDWAVKWNRLVCSFGTARADQWKDCRFEFTPQEDTTVSLELMGTQSLGGEAIAWTYYDDFRVEGAELVNGDFEEPAHDGRSPGWNCAVAEGEQPLSADQPGAVEPADGAASGKRCGKASHDERISQRISLHKGRKVVVEFQARAMLPCD